MAEPSRQDLKFLFIPVSSAEGIGEYMRSLILADAVVSRWPQAQIHFILNRDAPYAANCPYAADLLDETPTKRVAAVNRIISDYRPDVAIFDASGRRTQLQHAQHCGAKVVFISQHRRKRSRGLKWKRICATDSHLVVQPHFFIGDISWLERFKLWLLHKSEPLVIGPVFCPPNQARQTALLQQYQLQSDAFWLFNAGSGGHRVDGILVADAFAKAAAAMYQQTGMTCIVVYGPNYPQALPQLPGVIGIAAINNTDFISLLSAAKGAVLAGGDTLLQALALHVPTLAVSVSKDQFARVDSCVRQQLCLKADFNAAALVEASRQLQEPETINRLKQQMASQGLSNGLDAAIAQIEALL